MQHLHPIRFLNRGPKDQNDSVVTLQTYFNSRGCNFPDAFEYPIWPPLMKLPEIAGLTEARWVFPRGAGKIDEITFAGSAGVTM